MQLLIFEMSFHEIPFVFPICSRFVGWFWIDENHGWKIT
jgi:hypothetical protein